MHWEQIQGKWKQLKGSAKTRWGKLNDNDLDVINGRREQLVGLIQERYGIAKEAAEKQVNEWGASAVATSERETGEEPQRKVG